MSARYQLAHIHTLGMVVAAANAIEKELVLKNILGNLEIENKTKESIIEGIHNGLIAIDDKNKIIKMNRGLTNIFQINIKKLINKPVHNLDVGKLFLKIAQEERRTD